MDPETYFFVAMEMDGPDVIYLIIKKSDIGHYVVAKTYSPRNAKLIVAAFEADLKTPAPF